MKKATRKKSRLPSGISRILIVAFAVGGTVGSYLSNGNPIVIMTLGVTLTVIAGFFCIENLESKNEREQEKPSEKLKNGGFWLFFLNHLLQGF